MTPLPTPLSHLTRNELKVLLRSKTITTASYYTAVKEHYKRECSTS